MRKITTVGILLVFSFFSQAQKKKGFFDDIDMTVNIHINSVSLTQENWSGLFTKTPTGYSIDTFYTGPNQRRTCGFFVDLPPVSLGVRLAKTLFTNSDSRLLKDRVEWRTGILFGSRMNTSSLFTDLDYTQPPPSGVYTYKELDLSYRRNWIDIHNQLV